MQRTIERLRSEFLEMPGLKLTSAQVQRLCGVERNLCAAVLDALITEKFLYLRPDGTYVRLTDGALAPLRMARAAVDGDRVTPAKSA